jgi:hypothetical protein
LRGDQASDNKRGPDGGQQRLLPVRHHLGSSFEKIREIDDDGRLRQLRWLERQEAEPKPAVRVVRAVEEEDGDEKQCDDADEGENNRRTAVLFIVHLHQREHGEHSGHSPCQLA